MYQSKGVDLYEELIEPLPLNFRRSALTAVAGLAFGVLGIILLCVPLKGAVPPSVRGPLLEWLILLALVQKARFWYFHSQGMDWKRMMNRQAPLVVWYVPKEMRLRTQMLGQQRWEEWLYVQGLVLTGFLLAHGICVLLKTPSWEDFAFWPELVGALLLWVGNWAAWLLCSRVVKWFCLAWGLEMGDEVRLYEEGLRLPEQVVVWKPYGLRNLLFAQWSAHEEEGWLLLRLWTLLGVTYVPVPMAQAEAVQAFFARVKYRERQPL